MLLQKKKPYWLLHDQNEKNIDFYWHAFSLILCNDSLDVRI